MSLCLEERIFLVKEVYNHGGKYSKEVQNIFKEKFGEERRALSPRRWLTFPTTVMIS